MFLQITAEADLTKCALRYLLLQFVAETCTSRHATKGKPWHIPAKASITYLPTNAHYCGLRSSFAQPSTWCLGRHCFNAWPCIPGRLACFGSMLKMLVSNGRMLETHDAKHNQQVRDPIGCKAMYQDLVHTILHLDRKTNSNINKTKCLQKCKHGD